MSNDPAIPNDPSRQLPAGSHDICDRRDIRALVDEFYRRVRRDPSIGPLFDEVAKVDWLHHLPVMYGFWENVLFMNGAYGGNPMAAHLSLNRKAPLTKAHFDRWLELFTGTVDQLFEGEMAERAKDRALSIATIMQVRISGSNQTETQSGR